jgi:hypothetical protein
MRGAIPPLLQYVFMKWSLVKHWDNVALHHLSLIKWVAGALIPGIERPWREADHSSPSNAEVKKVWSYSSTPQFVFMAWCLSKRRDNVALPHINCYIN